MTNSGRAEFEVSIDGGRIGGIRTDGDPPALLLHGGPGLSFTYMDGLVDELDGLVGAISYQQRGLAPSSVGAPYGLRRHVEDAVALLDALGLGRAWMIGHSWGGYLAMAIAAWAPERTVGWIAVDPLGITGDGGMDDLGKWLGRNVTLDELARARAIEEDEEAHISDAETVSESLRIYWPHYFADPAKAPPYEDLSGNDRVYADAIPDAFALNETGELVRDLIASGRPGVVVTGGESGLRRASEESAAAAGARLVVVEGSGHFPWLEVPGSIRDVVGSTLGDPYSGAGT